MSSKDSSKAQGGLMSSAGLMTYYDAEEQHFAIDPKTILLFGIFISLMLAAVNILLV